MDAGFKAMAAADSGTVPAKFMDAFHVVKFFSTTYYKHIGYWKELTESTPALLEEAVRQGHTPAGEWSYVLEQQKAYGKGKASKST